ncbi:MAG: glycolate oxidase, partial [Chloroflexota bacterium]|nr:glycolate oxidase [Chloroflexota bacterium]
MGALIARPVLADLLRLAGPEAVSADEQDLDAAGTDFVGLRGRPGVVVRPATAEAAAAVVGYAGARGIPIFPRAAGTNLSGGFAPTPDGIVIDVSRMTRVIEIDRDAGRARVEPGVINADLQAAVAPMGLRFAPDPASAAISTIGGNIAENAGGPRCIRHGVTFHHVAGVSLALSEGRVLRLGLDDSVDLVGVVIGSEGILGLVTEATVRLQPVPPVTWTALAAFATVEAAAEAASAVIAAGLLPAKLEFCDRRQVELCEAHTPSGYPLAAAAILFVELEGEAAEVAGDVPRLEAVLRRFDPDLRVAATDADRARLWAGRLAAGHSYRATGKLFYICDVTVPRQLLPEMIARAREVAAAAGLDIATVAHAGDGNVHPVLL